MWLRGKDIFGKELMFRPADVLCVVQVSATELEVTLALNGVGHEVRALGDFERMWNAVTGTRKEHLPEDALFSEAKP